MDGSTIPYYVVEERKKLNRCIEEAPNDYEKEIYREMCIRDSPMAVCCRFSSFCFVIR